MPSIKSFLTPFGAVVAIVSLFLPWFKGHLTFVGKVVSGTAFPEIFWTVLIGCLATLAIFIYAMKSNKSSLNKWGLMGLSLATLLIAAAFIYNIGQRSTAPGVVIHVRHGVILTFSGLLLAAAGAVTWPNRKFDSNQP
jgi:hypothetical protein